MDVVTLGMAKADAKKKYDRDAAAAGLIKVHAALANRFTDPVNIVLPGDSIVEGAGATAPENTFARRFVGALRAYYPTPGVAGGKGFVNVKASTAGSYGLDQGVASGNAVADIWGFGKFSMKLDVSTGTGAGMVVFPNRTTLTSFDICYRAMGADSLLEYSIDGGTTWVTVPATAAGEQKYRVVPAGGRGTYTINVRYLSGTSTQVQGIMYYDGDETAGIRLWPAGASGTRAQQFSGGANGYWANALPKTEPDLVITEWLTNDMTLRTPAEYKADMLAVIGLVRVVPSVPILLAPPWKRPNSATVGLAPWDSYMAVLQEIALADPNTIVYDVNTRKPTDADTLGLLADGLHPNNKGHALLGDHYARALTR